MKKLFLILAPAVLMAGCAQELVITPPPAIEEEVTSEIPQRNVENAVYDDLLDMWMIPRTDPYTLKNFQAAYDNLASGKSSQLLTRAQADEFSEPEQLKPTHYALKIYPKSEEEQWSVEMMEDVQTLPMPFGYTPLTREESKLLVCTRSKDNTVERSPYTVTYVYTESTDGGPIGPQTFRLPILYTVWPASKPLPRDLEYELVYELFHPNSSPEVFSDAESMYVLSREAVAIAAGKSVEDVSPATRASGNITIRGSVKSYDNILERNVPVANLKIAFQAQTEHIGTVFENITYGVTDASGNFSFSVPPITSGEPYFWIWCFFEDPQGRWKIMHPGATERIIEWFSFLNNPAKTTLDVEIVLGLVPGGTAAWHQNNDLTQTANIHRAVNYFYNGQTTFQKPSIPGGIRIIANSGPNPQDPTGRGMFHATWTPTNGYSYLIDIYDRTGDTDGYVIGATLHELGHFAHCIAVGFDSYAKTHLFLRESSANYLGWYLGENYYISQGRSGYSGAADITGTGFQDWDKTMDLFGASNKGEYSPLFVDLTDNYNQWSNNNPNRAKDNIQNVPSSVVWSIIKSSQNWTQCRAKLQSYIGTYYTATQFNEWIDAFDDWVEEYY